MAKDCVFCKIVNGEISCHKIYEDDFVLAFLDVSNDLYGHTLVIPKKHYTSMQTCDNTTLFRVIEACKKIGNFYCDEKGFEGFNLLNNTGKVAGQTISHMHIHIFPRKDDDGIETYPNLPGCEVDLGEVCDALKLPKIENEKFFDDSKEVVLYTDGACSGNPGAGGWAAILSYKGNEKILTGGEIETTNNRMELMAVIVGLEAVKKGMSVNLFSDSAYVVNAFLQNWIGSWQKNHWRTAGKTEVQNKDLWQRLLAAMEGLDVKFNKVKGHADNDFNNRCDQLAREEIKKLKN